MARELDNLGPDFDQRWQRSAREAKRELIAELRNIYIFIEEEDMPLLSSQRAANTPKPPEKIPPQASLFDLPSSPSNGISTNTSTNISINTDTLNTHHADNSSSEASPPAATSPRKENPFLPKSVLERLHNSQTQTAAGLRHLIQPPAAPISHEQVDLERELRLKLGPIVEDLISAQIDGLKNELRLRIRAEMDKLIAEQVRKPAP